MKCLIFLLLLFFSSCTTLWPHQKQRFLYTTPDGQEKAVQLKVPRGFKIKDVNVDSAGNKEQVYRYVNGAVYYAAYSPDTARTYQPIDTGMNQPLTHRLGGLIYKGQDSSFLFWREIRMAPLTFGYRHVSRDNEIRFDEALNYSSLFKERKSR